MAVTCYDIEKFDGKADFALWKAKISAILGQQKAIKILMDPTKLSTTMTTEEKEVMESDAHGASPKSKW